jgi:hypothetical protein
MRIIRSGARGKPYGVNNQGIPRIAKRSAELRPSVRPSPTPLDPPGAGALPQKPPPGAFSALPANAASGRQEPGTLLGRNSLFCSLCRGRAANT